MVGMQHQRMIVQQLFDLSSIFEHMRQHGRKMVVGRDNVALLNKGPADDVLGRAALVNRQQVFFTQYVFDRLLKFDKTLRTGIRIVGLQHRGHLIVAHRIGSAVGQHVQVYIQRTQTERIETGLFDRVQAAFDRNQVEFLYHAHFVQFQGNVFPQIKFYLAHRLYNFG